MDGDDIPMTDYPGTQANPGYQDHTLPREHSAEGQIVLDVEGPGQHQNRRDSDASSYHDSDTEDPHGHHGFSKPSWAALSSPSETAILLESLPSRQLEQLANELASKGTLRHRPRRHRSIQKYSTLHIPHGKDAATEIAKGLQADPNLMDEIDGEFRTNEVIKDMPTNMANKRKIKRQMSSHAQANTRMRKLGWWKRMKYSLAIAWMHFKYQVNEVAYYLQLWKGHLKKIEGHFGTGVLSYFLFLKWIFYINIPIFILNLGFVVTPQILYRWHMQDPPGYPPTNVSFTGREILTGAYWFTDTEMYYGAYTNRSITLSDNSHSHYNMPHAYLFTTGGYYILSLVILLVSISKSYKKNYIEGSGAFDFYYVSRVFCGWDYGVTSKDAATLKHKGIFNEIKEYLSGVHTEKKVKTMGERCKFLSLRLMTNLFVFGTIGGSGYLIYFISEQQAVNTDLPVLSEMAMPLCVSGINLILPFVFHFIGRLESYEKPKNELWIEMLRTMLLKAVTLAVLVYFWFHLTNEVTSGCFFPRGVYHTAPPAIHWTSFGLGTPFTNLSPYPPPLLVHIRISRVPFTCLDISS
ncbi:hypothetical protein ScPMuIL_003513 [Solemya velum]